MKMDRYFKSMLFGAGILLLLLLTGIFFTLLIGSIPAIKASGIKFLSGTSWNPVTGVYGAVPFVIGTLLTSFLALFISLPFSFSISLFLGEYFKKGALAEFLNYATDILASIPSVIYGFWGLLFLVPIVRKFELSFHILPYGVGIFTASLILAVMIIPYTSYLAKEVILLVPQDIKEAAYSLGATRSEVIRKVIVPYSRSGIFAGILLSLGRALGETMAVTMVIGNSNLIPGSIFSPGNTMASVIANEFTEATNDVHLSALIELGLLLFIITGIINFIGNVIIKKLSIKG